MKKVAVSRELKFFDIIFPSSDRIYTEFTGDFLPILQNAGSLLNTPSPTSKNGTSWPLDTAAISIPIPKFSIPSQGFITFPGLNSSTMPIGCCLIFFILRLLQEVYFCYIFLEGFSKMILYTFYWRDDRVDECA